jgi:acyl-CoA thioester hydrolase
VYYEDTDAGGVVYYANYLKFMERARTEWLRALGFEQTQVKDEHNVVFVVRALAAEYLRPALFNDELAVSVTLLTVRGSLLEIAQTVRRGQHDLVTGSVKIACVNTQSFKPVRIPQTILKKLA